MTNTNTNTTTTSIPIPTSLTTTTPQLPPLTSHLLLSHLRTTGVVAELHTQLSDQLARTGWTDRVRALALELLRNGSCETFPELYEEVLRRAREGETDGDAKKAAAVNGNGTSNTTQQQQQQQQAIVISKDWCGADGLPDVRVPRRVVDAASAWLVQRVEGVCEVVDDE